MYICMCIYIYAHPTPTTPPNAYFKWYLQKKIAQTCICLWVLKFDKWLYNLIRMACETCAKKRWQKTTERALLSACMFVIVCLVPCKTCFDWCSQANLMRVIKIAQTHAHNQMSWERSIKCENSEQSCRGTKHKQIQSFSDFFRFFR